MAVVKANYVKRGRGEQGRAKATIRYITHRRDRDGQRVTRPLFGYDGELSKAQAYRMIDEAPRGTIFYRIVVSPDPKREDRFKDLNLAEITLDTMLRLEERLGRPVQFVATLHDDHSDHRHVHTLILLKGRRLTREDFAALRQAATGQAFSQRRLRDLTRGSQRAKSHARASRAFFHTRHTRSASHGRGSRPWQGYSCPLCGYHQALPASGTGYRCPADGLRLRRDQPSDQYQTQRRTVGRVLSLSP